MRRSLLLVLLLLVATLAGCGDSRPPARSSQAYNDFALQFTRALGRRDYTGAHAMLASSYAAQVGAAKLQSEFEQLVPRNVGVTKVEAIGEPLTDWPDRAPEQTAILYVTLEGTGLEEFEALSLTLGEEGGQQKVSGIEYGRMD
jgi:hypothetical protein